MAVQSEVSPRSETPPVSDPGIVHWLKENLFSSIPNTILTLLSGYLLFVILRALIRFIFIEADWTVVTSNLTLFAIGQYPRDQAWRVSLSLGVVVVLGIATAIFWRRSNRLRQALTVLWLISPPVIWVILEGFTDSSILPEVRTGLWSGLLLTVMLTVVGIVASFPMGILLALGRRSDLPIIKLLCTAYIEIIRGVPLISILFMAQILLPLFLGIEIDAVLRAMAGITLFSAAYVAEIVRGGLQAIPRGQVEAAQALGLNAPLITGLIVLPQALRIVIPTLVGQFISLFKDTSLVSIATLYDLMGITKLAINQSADFQSHAIEAYLFVAAIYFAFSYVISSAARRIEVVTARMGGTRNL
jgi:general L-amino acid transport system permease protein